jgi:hypothetical protein
MKIGGQAFKLGLVALGTVWADTASAQVSAPDKASAEALFNDGIALVAAGSFAEGCAKFEGSQALEPTLGTELRLADCYDRLGKTASAWALFKESQGVAHRQGEVDREDLARERADDLARRLSFLVLQLDEPLPAGLRVERNQHTVPTALLGGKIPVDPGPQVITLSAPGRKGRTESVLVPPGPGVSRLRISPLEPEELPPRIVAVRMRRAEPHSDPTPHSDSTPHSDPRRSIGIITSVAGAVGVATGAGLGWYAKHENDRSRSDVYCPNAGHNGCTHAGVAMRERAQTFARASTVVLAASSAVLATGVVLWSTSKSRSEPGVAKLTEIRVLALPGAAEASLGASW